MRAQRAQEVAIGAQFPYRTFVVRHMTERGRQPNQQQWPKQRQPNQQWWPNVARIGAKTVANIPTQVHEPGAILVGAGPGESAPGLPGLLAQTGGGDHGGGAPY